MRDTQRSGGALQVRLRVRACRLQVNAHGSHGTSPPFRDKFDTPGPTRHRCLISRNPSVESASRWILVSRIGTFLALFRFALSHLSVVPSPRKTRVTAFDGSTHRRGPYPEPRADAFDPETETGHSLSGRPTETPPLVTTTCKKPRRGSLFGSEDAPGRLHEEAFVPEAGIGSADGFGDGGKGGAAGRWPAPQTRAPTPLKRRGRLLPRDGSSPIARQRHRVRRVGIPSSWASRTA